MCANVGILLLGFVERDSFDSLTWEFLSTFYDDLNEKGTQCMVSFDLNHQHYDITFEQFCNTFGFPHDGETKITNAYSQSCAAAWEAISTHGDRNFYQKKMTTIQNPTICYFTMFLANTLLGRGDTGSMAKADMAMITRALFPSLP